MKPFLIVQIRPEDEAADNEFEAFLNFGQLSLRQVKRVQADGLPLPDINLSDFSGVIVGGGPANISDSDKNEIAKRMEGDIMHLLSKIVESDFPFLGACYGFGALIAHLGGQMSKERYSEDVGAFDVRLEDAGKNDPLTKGLPDKFRAYGGHKEACQELPKSCTLLASSDACPVQMVRVKKNIYGTQFHPELDTNGIVVRINVYKHAGYFPPQSADKLIKTVQGEVVTAPVEILRRFTSRYSS